MICLGRITRSHAELLMNNSEKNIERRLGPRNGVEDRTDTVESDIVLVYPYHNSTTPNSYSDTFSRSVDLSPRNSCRCPVDHSEAGIGRSEAQHCSKLLVHLCIRSDPGVPLPAFVSCPSKLDYEATYTGLRPKRITAPVDLAGARTARCGTLHFRLFSHIRTDDEMNSISPDCRCVSSSAKH